MADACLSTYACPPHMFRMFFVSRLIQVPLLLETASSKPIFPLTVEPSDAIVSPSESTSLLQSTRIYLL